MNALPCTPLKYILSTSRQEHLALIARDEHSRIDAFPAFPAADNVRGQVMTAGLLAYHYLCPRK